MQDVKETPEQELTPALKAAAYTNEIEPLVVQIHELCKRYKMPMLITIQQDQQAANENEMKSELRGVAHLDETACPAMVAAYHAIMGAHPIQIMQILMDGALRPEPIGTRH